MKGVILLILCVLIYSNISAQPNERIKYRADDLYEYRQNGERIRKLVGNVVFKQKTSTMYCDSSLFYTNKNIMEAYGSIRIVDDSVNITSGRLTYNGKDRTAMLRENVIYTKGEQSLNTHFLNYNLETEVGNYFESGTLRDSTNTLKSEIGYFYGKQHYALFWKSVQLDAPDFVLTTDTLRYNTLSKVAKTEGNTIINSEDGTYLHAYGGEFRTINDQSQFIEGQIETTDYYLEGDELFFDDLKKYYDAKGNVKLTAKNEDVIILGDEGYTDNASGISKIYGNALMKRILKRDTLYMTADTLVSIESEYDSAKRILAYNNVKMWRFNLQGIAGSATYFLHDSLLYFYDDPVFWNKKNQIEADTIYLEIMQEQIKFMHLRHKAFLASEDTLGNKNQIKGRHMVATFSETAMQNIEVTGNGESIYYVLDDSDSLNVQTLGMNRILCSDMMIRFSDQKLKNITFYVSPEAKFIPPHKLNDDIQKLPGYAWRIAERPVLEDLLYGGTIFEYESLPKNKVILGEIPPLPINIEPSGQDKKDLLKENDPKNKK